MGIIFNVDEVLELAEQIERNGAVVYRRAAGAAEDARVRELFLHLAGMEDDHEKTFVALRREVAEDEKAPTVFDPEGEGVRYLRAVAAGHVFDLTGDPEAGFTGTEALDQVLRRAITAEKDSVVYYVGLKEVVPEYLGRDKLDGIIKEEMSHITLLAGELAELENGCAPCP